MGGQNNKWGDKTNEGTKLNDVDDAEDVSGYNDTVI